jgi:tellurite resistance-related uncharacterized protein
LQKFNTKFYQKIRLKIMCLQVSYKKKMKKEVGSGSTHQRYGSADPDPHQNVPGPQHWFKVEKESDGE